MKKKKKEIGKLNIALWIIFGVIIVGWISLFVYCSVKFGDETTYVFSEEDPGGSQEGLTIESVASKEWSDYTLHADMPHGAQYDITVTNDSEFDFYNLKVRIDFDGPVEFDSGWNGDYEIKDNSVFFTADDMVYLVPAGESKTFGAVLYTTKDSRIESYTVSGCWNMDVRKTGLFWALVEVTIIYILVVILQMVYLIREKKLQQKVDHDAMIIEQALKTLTGFIDAKDAYTKDHSARVAEYAREIGKRVGMNENDVNNLFYITLMHDCGKISIPDEILKKKGALTPEEFAIVKTHTTKGSELLRKFTALEGIGDGAHYHHERYDGYGYPAGLEAEDIPLFARIICVADAYDAMSSNRCYRKALSKEKILSELTLNSGKQFDPKFVPIMISMIEDGFVDSVKAEYPLE